MNSISYENNPNLSINDKINSVGDLKLLLMECASEELNNDNLNSNFFLEPIKKNKMHHNYINTKNLIKNRILYCNNDKQKSDFKNGNKSKSNINNKNDICKLCGTDKIKTMKQKKIVENLENNLANEQKKYLSLQEKNLKLQSALDLWKHFQNEKSKENGTLQKNVNYSNINLLKTQESILDFKKLLNSQKDILDQLKSELNNFKEFIIDKFNNNKDISEESFIEKYKKSYENLHHIVNLICELENNINSQSNKIIEQINEMNHVEINNYTMKEKLDYYKRIAESYKSRKINNIPTGKIAIVFTDIESSTSLWMKDPKGMQDSIDMHNILLRNIIEKHNGLEVKNEGDAFFVVFQTCKDALEFSLEVQLKLPKLEWPKSLFSNSSISTNSTIFTNSNISTTSTNLTNSSSLTKVSNPINSKEGYYLEGLKVRIGIHFDEAAMKIDDVTKRPDYFGTPINKASRICALARGGQILMSNNAYKEIEHLTSKGVGIPLWTKRKGTARLRGMESDPEILWLVYPKGLSNQEQDTLFFSDQNNYNKKIVHLKKKNIYQDKMIETVSKEICHETSQSNFGKNITAPILNLKKIQAKFKKLQNK